MNSDKQPETFNLPEIPADETITMDFDQDFETEVLEANPEYPQFWIIRGEDRTLQTRYFHPQDLLTLVIKNTGIWRITKITMSDNEGQNRYTATSGGSYHILTTRIQNTRSYGEWLLHIEGPLKSSEEIFQVNLRFFVNETIPYDAIGTTVRIAEENDTVEIEYEFLDFHPEDFVDEK